MDTTVFNFVKIKPIADLLGMSNARFTQKLYQYHIKGQEQKFSEAEWKTIKNSLLTLSALIKEEAEQIEVKGAGD